MEKGDKKGEKDFESKVKKIIDTFTKAEKLGKENTKKYKDWIKDISDPNFKLISNLLTYFLDELTTSEMREDIFKIFRKLYFLTPEVVAPQIIECSDFSKAIVVHITTGDKSKISDNCFYLLTKLYTEKGFQSVIDEKFIEALFEGLKIVHEEDILNDIVVILIEINFKYTENDENLFLKVHAHNENSRVLNEILLRVLNNETDDEKMLKTLKCLIDLMGNQKKSIFYESDLESFVDILLPKLQMTDNNDLRKKLLDSLDRVTKYDEYYSEMYKVDEITELMEDFESAEDQPNEIREISKQIVINITDRQGKKKNNNENKEEDS